MSNAADEIVLDAINWREKNDFYIAYSNSTEAPTWFGFNMDAFNDSLSGGICKITPVKIVFRNVTQLVRDALGSEFWSDIEEICQDQEVQLEIHID